ncbi:unnamed protein product [Owenia fusiformis]|uniref:Uncharacterized protein n=1 Tax=Owenia fusiformis TaxID=6347 RepID=A0A8J1Y606_OWEFU|nr:unnamed protein product [Owenia fusiformis]
MSTSPVYVDVQENDDDRHNINSMETKNKKIDFSDRTMKSRDNIRTFAFLGLVLLSLVILILAGIFITSINDIGNGTCTNSTGANFTCSQENSTKTDATARSTFPLTLKRLEIEVW